MTAPSAWFAKRVERWLLGFKDRHGLSAVEPPAPTGPAPRVLLHVGCGWSSIAQLPVAGFLQNPWQEVRLDADAAVQPDIEGSMTDMSAVPAEFADAVYSSHGIEHLYWHDVPRALAEFKRVLNSDGFVVITCPDLQAAAAMIAEDRLFETAYESPAGSITPFDILYSYRPFVEQNPQWMSHHCGFTFSTLTGKLREAGFPSIAGFRRPDAFDLWVVASKSKRPDAEMQALAQAYLVATA